MARRTVLFSPGDRPEMLRKAPRTGADVVVFDLEDAVAPADRPTARATVRSVVTDPAFDPDGEVVVRVSDDREADLDAILRGIGVESATQAQDQDPTADGDAMASERETTPRIDAVMGPKTAGAGDVRALASAALARGHDLPVFALCETARGVVNADAIADAGPTTALCFGAEDLIADAGATHARGRVAGFGRERILLAARAAGIDAIDAVFTDVNDADGLREDAAEGAAMGYDGKMVIHPRQVATVHEALVPPEADLAWARRVVAAAAETEGVFRLDDQMIDAPLIARARRLLERAGESASSS